MNTGGGHLWFTLGSKIIQTQGQGPPTVSPSESGISPPYELSRLIAVSNHLSGVRTPDAHQMGAELNQT